jgi:plastocyanin
MRGALLIVLVLALLLGEGADRASARQQGTTVQIVDFAFQPESLTVAVGATVTWTHAGQAPHTVTSETRLFDSGRLAAGQTFAFTFTAPGTFAYRCEVHPARMAGTVTVQGSAGGPLPPGSELRGALGEAVFGDAQARSNQVLLQVQGLQPPAGATATVWLATASAGAPQRLGTLTPDGRGNATLTYTDGQQRNLIALYDRVVVSAEAGAGVQPAGAELLRGEVNAAAMVHIRHLLAGIEVTPKNTPLATGLLEQTALAAEHARLARAAVQNNDLAAARLHLEHVVNIIEGERGPNFGDLNKDERRDNPGDGFGVLTYAELAIQHAQLAIDAAPRDETVKLHGGHVITSVRNAVGWAREARDQALPLFRVTDLAALRQPVDNIAALLSQALEGRDANRDGRIDPVPGEGAARTAYNHAQLMASVTLTAAAVVAPAPAVTQAAAATPAVAAPTSAARTGTSGTRLVLIALAGTAAFLLLLVLAAWRWSGRRTP